MNSNPEPTEECPAIKGMQHLWSIPSLRGVNILRSCLWCNEWRSLDKFPEYSGPVLDGNKEIGTAVNGFATLHN